MRRLVYLVLVAAMVATPAMASSFTYTNQVAGRSFGPYFMFDGKPGGLAGNGVFTYDDCMGGLESSGLTSDVSVYGFYPSYDLEGALSLADFAAGSDAGTISFMGIFATTDVTFDDGWVTILGTLAPMPGEVSYFTGDALNGIGGPFMIPDWDRYIVADVSISFRTSADSLDAFFRAPYMISDAYLTISGTSVPDKTDPVAAVPEPLTMLMVMTSLGGLAYKYRRDRILARNER